MKRLESWAVNYEDVDGMIRVKVEDSRNAMIRFLKNPPACVRRFVSQAWEMFSGERM